MNIRYLLVNVRCWNTKPEDRAILIAREHCHLWKGFKKGKLKFNTMIDWNTLKSMLKIWNEIQFPVAELKNLYSFPAKSYFIGTWLECRMGRLSFVELTRLLLQYYECFSVIAKINIHISPLHLYTISASKSKVLCRFSQPLFVQELGFPHLAIKRVRWRSLKESLVGRVTKHGDLESFSGWHLYNLTFSSGKISDFETLWKFIYIN